MASTDFDFTDGVSGYVSYNGLAYSVGTGWANCYVQKYDLSGVDKRAMFHFDTSSLPDDATIEQVLFYVSEGITQPLVAPDHVYLYLGSWIGATLDASAADYNGGTNMNIDILPYGDDVWIDLNDGLVDPTVLVSKAGTTDVALRGSNDSVKNGGRYYNESKVKCQLSVVYSVAGGARLTTLFVG